MRIEFEPIPHRCIAAAIGIAPSGRPSIPIRLEGWQTGSGQGVHSTPSELSNHVGLTPERSVGTDQPSPQGPRGRQDDSIGQARLGIRLPEFDTKNARRSGEVRGHVVERPARRMAAITPSMRRASPIEASLAEISPTVMVEVWRRTPEGRRNRRRITAPFREPRSNSHQAQVSRRMSDPITPTRLVASMEWSRGNI